MIIQSLFLMIPCEFLNVNMCVRRKTRQFRNTHYYPGCHPLPSPLQLPLRTDQPPQAGADRGVEPVQGLWGPRPRGQRVKQRRDGIQVSREILTIDKRLPKCLTKYILPSNFLSGTTGAGGGGSGEYEDTEADPASASAVSSAAALLQSLASHGGPLSLGAASGHGANL